MIRCMNRMEEHQQGHILVDGIELTNDLKNIDAIRREVGMVFQHFNLFPHLTVLGNTLFGIECGRAPLAGRLFGAARRAALAEAEEMLAAVGLEDSLHLYPAQMSGGMQQRLAIAQALIKRPRILLLDEPFAGIDPLSISDIRDLVKDLRTRGIGVLITDHNVRETLEIVDRACIIYGGQVLFAVTPEALVADENVRRLYLGESFTL